MQVPKHFQSYIIKPQLQRFRKIAMMNDSIPQRHVQKHAQKRECFQCTETREMAKEEKGGERISITTKKSVNKTE
jgi:hypothetical protein